MRRLNATIVGVLSILILFFMFPQEGLAHSQPALKLPRQLRVMTQNLYVGADLNEVVYADPSDPLAVPEAVADVYARIVAADFPDRARAIASEVARFLPDVLALQEISLIRRQSPGDYLEGNPIPAQTVVYDYLEILMNALDEEGLDYEVAGQVQDSDVELPMLVGFAGTQPLFDDARLTDSDVILCRSGVSTSNIMAGNYAVNLQASIDGSTVTFVRGYVGLTATVRGRTYRVVNTHLEVNDDPSFYPIQAAQAQELLGILKETPGPLVLVGDLNSSPADPHTQPYWQLRSAGYVDTWLRSPEHFEKGYTCCQAPDLENDTSELSQRIDHIFVRNELGMAPITVSGPVLAGTVGDQPEDKTEGGLWPSDHAGRTDVLWIPFPPGNE